MWILGLIPVYLGLAVVIGRFCRLNSVREEALVFYPEAPDAVEEESAALAAPTDSAVRPLASGTGPAGAPDRTLEDVLGPR